MRRNPTAADYEALADQQRGEPERAMREAQFALGGGALSYALEHTGDITHRMNESASRATSGGVEKVKKVLRALRSGYGFEREVRENAKDNAAYGLEKDGIPSSEYKARVARALDAYARAHEALPSYNRAQLLAKKAAVSLARGNFRETEKALAELDKHTGSQEEWRRFSLEGLEREPMRLPNPPRDIECLTPLGGECGVWAFSAATGKSIPDVRRAYLQAGVDIWDPMTGTARRGTDAEAVKKIVNALGAWGKIVEVGYAYSGPRGPIGVSMTVRAPITKERILRGDVNVVQSREGETISSLVKRAGDSGLAMIALLINKIGVNRISGHMVGYSPSVGFYDTAHSNQSMMLLGNKEMFFVHPPGSIPMPRRRATWWLLFKEEGKGVV